MRLLVLNEDPRAVGTGLSAVRYYAQEVSKMDALPGHVREDATRALAFCS